MNDAKMDNDGHEPPTETGLHSSPPSSINVLLNEAIHFVYTLLVDDKSSLKAHQENVHHGAFKPVIITHVRIWRVKRGEGICSKGMYYRELVCTKKGTLVLHNYMLLAQLQHPILMGGRGLADPLVPKNRIQHVSIVRFDTHLCFSQ